LYIILKKKGCSKQGYNKCGWSKCDDSKHGSNKSDDSRHGSTCNKSGYSNQVVTTHIVISLYFSTA